MFKKATIIAVALITMAHPGRQIHRHRGHQSQTAAFGPAQERPAGRPAGRHAQHDGDPQRRVADLRDHGGERHDELGHH